MFPTTGRLTKPSKQAQDIKAGWETKDYLDWGSESSQLSLHLTTFLLYENNHLLEHVANLFCNMPLRVPMSYDLNDDLCVNSAVILIIQPKQQYERPCVAQPAWKPTKSRWNNLKIYVQMLPMCLSKSATKTRRSTAAPNVPSHLWDI